MPYLGLSIAGSVRIGNALGAGDVHRAEVASNLTLVTAAMFRCEYDTIIIITEGIAMVLYHRLGYYTSV